MSATWRTTRSGVSLSKFHWQAEVEVPELHLSNVPMHEVSAPSIPPALQEMVEKAAHFLPAQGPITSFVHHNTLHAFESLRFEEGVEKGGQLYGCHAYLAEEKYREYLQSGRIRVADLESILLEDLQEDADHLVALFGTRYALRLTLLRYPIHFNALHELRWAAAESDALRKFRSDIEAATREKTIRTTRQWLLRCQSEGSSPRSWNSPLVQKGLASFDAARSQAWSPAAWEACILGLLWQACLDGVAKAGPCLTRANRESETLRHRDVILAAGGEDADQLVNTVLIPFCSALLDQGYANAELPERELGIYHAFLRLYGASRGVPGTWETAIHDEVRRLNSHGIGHLQSIEESLDLLGIPRDDWEEYITQSLLALRGWAGMIWQLETEARWVRRPVPEGSLLEFLAIRLVLDRLAAQRVARKTLGYRGPLDQIRQTFGPQERTTDKERFTCRAFTIFQIAQLRGWGPANLIVLTKEQWASLIREIESFSNVDRRRLFHLAFERKYANAALDAVLAHTSHVADITEQSVETQTSEITPAFQVVTCIDDREESLRRHLEEIEPNCETFGVAGFFGVAMFYRGIEDATFNPLAPAGVTPSHYVSELPVFSEKAMDRRRALRRRQIGQATHRAHLGSRSLLGGIVAGVLGSGLALLLLPQVFFPRWTSEIFQRLRSLFQTPDTEMLLERQKTEMDTAERTSGYSVPEMANIVENVLRAIGLVRKFSHLVLFVGHGSATQNNPHESAYNCGACSGGRGGPNARAFAMMANDPRVRVILAERGLSIPESTYFVGGYHDTTNDAITFADLDRMPQAIHPLFDHVLTTFSEASARNAQERCRRFESVPADVSAEEALAAVRIRAESLSQPRPEYNHATNAICLVGRRAWHRGLFMDRRAFLPSYDPQIDDERGTILEGMLKAVIPVTAGISLEYYFSTVDPEGYGCGSKLPHNIVSLLGVMSGAASDLRPGLSSQMVEIHEPMRILFVIETTPDVIERIIKNNPAIARLVRGEWVQLAVFDPIERRIARLTADGFVPYRPNTHEISVAKSSKDWYGGQRGHLGFATIGSPLSRTERESTRA